MKVTQLTDASNVLTQVDDYEESD